MSGLLEIVGYRPFKRNVSSKLRSCCDFVHVTIRRMKQCSSRCCSKNGNGVWFVVSTIVGAFEWVDSDVDARHAFDTNSATQLLTNEQHRCFVTFAFSYGDTTIEWNCIEGTTHGFDCSIVCSVLVTFTSPCGTGNRSLVNGLKKVVSKVCGTAHVLSNPRANICLFACFDAQRRRLGRPGRPLPRELCRPPGPFRPPPCRPPPP